MRIDRSGSAALPPRRSLRDGIGRVRHWLTSDDDRSVAQRIAGTAFLIRASSACTTYAIQVLLARWMGTYEYGIYIYVSAWLLLVGDLVPLGLSTIPQRFIPEYRTTGQNAALRGFISGTRWIVLAAGSLTGGLCAGLIWMLSGFLEPHVVLPLLLVCLALPAHGLMGTVDGIAASFGWNRLALLPLYILKPALIFGAIALIHAAGQPATAVNAMMAVVAATTLAALIQLALVRRAMVGVVPPGPREYRVREWLTTSFPVLVTRGLYTLIACTDILVLQHFRAPDEIGLYYAAAKAMALVSFIAFAVGRGTDYKFSEYQASGDKAALGSMLTHAVALTFWPSLVATGFILAIGKPFLALFGPDFTSAYPLMFLLAIGLLARASVGPAERLLTTLGQQRICAVCYGIAFAVCLGGCFALIPPFGTVGAAIATSTAMVVESALLVWAARSRLGLNATMLG